MTNKQLLTIQEAAAELRVDTTTMRRWIHKGAIEAVLLPGVGRYKTYRIRRATLIAILK